MARHDGRNGCSGTARRGSVRPPFRWTSGVSRCGASAGVAANVVQAGHSDGEGPEEEGVDQGGDGDHDADRVEPVTIDGGADGEADDNPDEHAERRFEEGDDL